MKTVFFALGYVLLGLTAGFAFASTTNNEVETTTTTQTQLTMTGTDDNNIKPFQISKTEIWSNNKLAEISEDGALWFKPGVSCEDTLRYAAGMEPTPGQAGKWRRRAITSWPFYDSTGSAK